MVVRNTVEMRIMPVEQLTPATYNPRRDLAPTSPAYRKLKSSIETFGLVEPLVWNELTGRVVGGHLRLRILKELGMTEVPVSVVQLEEMRERALNVVLNNQEAQGRYDPVKLLDLLGDLQGLPELEMTGFETSTLGLLQYEPAATPPPTTDQRSRVEIRLLTDPQTYEQLEGRLDALIREFDLEVHLGRAC